MFENISNRTRAQACLFVHMTVVLILMSSTFHDFAVFYDVHMCPPFLNISECTYFFSLACTILLISRIANSLIQM